MKKEITEAFLRSLKAPDTGRIEVSDTKRLGLRLRHYAPTAAHSKGKAVWMYEKRIKGGKKRKHTFGNWPTFSLSDARTMALEIEAEAARGIDRVAIAEQERIQVEAEKASIITVESVIDAYWELHLSDLKTGADCLREIKAVFLHRLDSPIKDITANDLQSVMDAKVRLGQRVYANRIRSYVLAFTKWCWLRKHTETHVGFGIPKATKETPRDRVLSLQEVQQIWNATFELRGIFGPLYRLVILTGQRRGEIAGLRGAEVNFNKTQMEKLGAQTKNAKPHITHLSLPAIEELMNMAPLPKGYLFTTTGVTPVSGFSKAKKRLDKLLGGDFEPWTIHDIRTAMATALAESKIPETVVDRIQNHQATGSAPSAVSRVYNHAQQLTERAIALDKWAEMVTGELAKVVSIHGLKQ